MKKIGFSLLLFLSLTAFAAEPVDVVTSTLERQDKGMMSFLIGLLPESTKQGLGDYIKVSGMSADGQANFGIRGYNEATLEKNSCFHKMASDFYTEVHLKGVKFKIDKLAKHEDHILLYEASPDGGMYEGWLWDLALKHAKNDPNVAFQLIGLCGHDDVRQALVMKPSTDFGLQHQIRSWLLENKRKYFVRENVTCQNAKIPGALPDSCFYDVYSAANEIENLSKRVWCPTKPHPMFLPKSLGAEVDIFPELMEQIVNIKSPEVGALGLPAKYYHTIAGAYMGHFLARRGISQFMARKIVTRAINGYRAGGLCRRINGTKLKNIHMLNWVHLPALSEEALSFIKDQTHGCHLSTPNSRDSRLCSILRTLPKDLKKDKSLSKEKIMKLLKNKMAEADAVELFKSSDDYQDNNRCEGSQLDFTVRDYFSDHGSQGSSNPCPSEWPEERCENVRKVMGLWAIEFEWSEGQHMAGLNFAYEKSSVLSDDDEDPVARTCVDSK